MSKKRKIKGLKAEVKELQAYLTDYNIQIRAYKKTIQEFSNYAAEMYFHDEYQRLKRSK